jgi:uncharacterized membrane protein (UPF0127 family)
MRSRVCAALAVMVALASCSPSLSEVKVTIKGVEFTIEVARTQAEQEKGLMYRKTLGEREGMIFVYDRDQHLTFWMKNTSIPLSIAFLSAEGKIIQIEEMQPFSLEPIRSRLSCRFALELPRNAFRELGAVEGDAMALPAGLE